MRPAVLALLVLALAPGVAQATTKTYTLRTKPIQIGKYGVLQDTTSVRFPRVDGYITRMQAYAVDRKGRRMPVQRVMLHHVLFTNRGRRDGARRDGTCPDIPRERVYGTGEENQVLRLPRGYGIPVRRGERWSAAWMVMNHTDRLDAAQIQYEVTIVSRRKLTPVKAYWLDVTGCRGGVAYTVPGGGAPGSTDTKSFTWTVPANGRLVAGGAHLHGSAKRMSLLQQRCDNRVLAESRPLYGMPDNIVYHVLPVLHEPGPIDTSWFMTGKGIPLVKGEQITVNSEYDAELPHPRVMGVDHVYMARGGAVPSGCAPLPGDMTNTNAPVPGRTESPQVTVPLTGIGPDGRAQPIDRPPGEITSLADSAAMTVDGTAFRPANLSIPLGASLTWNFTDRIRHNVTLANGPQGLSSPNLSRGRGFTHQFTRPGTYRLFCTLHPVYMQQVVDVRDATAPLGKRAPVRPRRSRDDAVIHW